MKNSWVATKKMLLKNLRSDNPVEKHQDILILLRINMKILL